MMLGRDKIFEKNIAWRLDYKLKYSWPIFNTHFLFNNYLFNLYYFIIPKKIFFSEKSSMF